MKKVKLAVWTTAFAAIALAAIGYWFCCHSDMTSGEFGLIAKRGRILAADGSPLAYTVRNWMFHVDPMAADIAALDIRTIQRISDGLDIPAKVLIDAYIPGDAAHGGDTQTPRRYIYLKEALDGGRETQFFEENRIWLVKRCGIIREPVQSRVYPLGAAATAVTGFMHGGVHQEKPRGAAGMESALDAAMSGRDGICDKSLPAKERCLKAAPTAGDDVHTTIIPGLQTKVSDIIAAACATNGAESAWAVVMRVSDGAIAAMASYPRFDPCARRSLDTEGKEWTMAINHASGDVFEPGGLVKPLTYAIAIGEGVLSVDSHLDQEGGTWEYNGVTFNDEVANTLSIAEAIECRANIAAGKTACLIGPDRFHAALRRLGFGAKTCASGISGEEVGILPATPENWRMDKTTAMRVGMGYGFAVTGLQIAQAYAALANHGRLVRPCLVKGTESVGEQAVDPVAADTIFAMLKKPMTSTVQMYGNGKYIENAYIASCAGFLDDGQSQYAIILAFAKPHPAYTGEEVARPVWEEIAGEIQRSHHGNRF